MNPKSLHYPANPDDYVKWINRCIGEEIRARRREVERWGGQDLSAYELGRAAKVSDQAVLNIEQAVNPNGSWTGTIARIALRLGSTLPDIVVAATRRS